MELFGGLAIERVRGEGFVRWSEAPLLGRQDSSPLLNTAPWVVENGKGWRMFYVAGIEWKSKDEPRYHIRQADSSNLVEWELSDEVAVELEFGENALARPVVTKLHGHGWHMWFSRKGEVYEPRRAVSDDGVKWTRLTADRQLTDQLGAREKMIEYFVPTIIEGQEFLLYNGSNYGRDGILVAQNVGNN